MHKKQYYNFKRLQLSSSEMEFLSHEAAESAALMKWLPEKINLLDESRHKSPRFCLSHVQRHNVFSKISPVLFSEMRSLSSQQCYTCVFIGHTITSQVFVLICPPNEMAAVVTQTMSMSSISRALRQEGSF